MAFENYFNEQNIINLLCKYRVKAAKNNHKIHLFGEISSSHHIKEKLRNLNTSSNELYSMLPPRRQWIRPDKSARLIEDSQAVAIKSIKRKITKTKIKLNLDPDSEPEWHKKLNTFVETLLQDIQVENSTIIGEPNIKPIKKEEKVKNSECRALSVYGLRDKIIISLTAKYLTDEFESIFLECSYAFRSNKVRTLSHHDAIIKLIEYRQKNTGDLWVSECDIKKFFDCVNHKIVLENFYSLIREEKLDVDTRAINLFKSYLNSYSFNKHVYPKNNTGYFKALGLEGCLFPWPAGDLYVNFYGLSNNFNQPIGVPQGGAISCFIANLVMHHVDQMVFKSNADEKLLYMRFCDDMIIVHPDKKGCNDALKRYEDAVFSQNLLTHEAKLIGSYSKDFWNQKIKSKNPYRWGSKNITGNIPWVSFVGYQIRYDGNARIRKVSLKKEIEKQRHEVNEVIKALGQRTNKYYPNSSDIDINFTSKKSIRQQIHSAHSRLISMSVGRVALYNKDKTFGMCWTNGFKSLNKNSIIESQLKQLDRFRNKHIFFLKKRLSHLEKNQIKLVRLSK